MSQQKPKLTTSPLEVGFSQQEIDNFARKVRMAAEAGDSRAVTDYFEHMRNMDADQVQMLLRMFDELRQGGFSSSFDGLWQLDFDRKPVSFEEWIDDPYYMGNVGKELYPLWREELSYILHPKSGIIEWLVTGSIGSGKTYVSLLAQIYKGPYYCSCLRNPQGYFGLAENSEIVFGLFNTILDNATHVDFNQIARFVNASGYFRDHCPPDIKWGSAKIYWPQKDLLLRTGSGDLHVLGQNLFGYMIDEVNFMKKPETKKEDEHQAQTIYHHATRRMKSRFQRFGTCPGLAIIASSRLAQSSFLEDLMKVNKDNPQCHVSDYALWDTKGRERYSPKTFRVLIGNQYRKSEILDTMDTSSGSPMTYERIPEKAKSVPEGCQYLEVPADFYYDFQQNIEGSLRDIAGLATYGVSPLIWRVECVAECRDESRSHPFLAETHTLSMEDEQSDLILYMKWGELTNIKGGTHVPRYHPGMPRFVHCDLGLVKDAAAISMGCPYDYYIQTSHDPLTGQVTDTFKPKVWVDFMLRIEPVRGEEIDLTKIVSFILNLRNYGFHLQRVTFDGYASEMAIQIIRKAAATPERKRLQLRIGDPSHDLEADVLSMDKTDKPYRLLRDVLGANAISYYPYPWFEKEVLGLEHDPTAKAGKGEVNHKPKESKDVSDAVAGVVWGVSTSKAGLPGTPVKESTGDIQPAVPQVDTLMGAAIMGDYPDADRVRALIPAPKPEANPVHKLRTGRQGWMSQLAADGFGRHRRNIV